MRAVVIDEATKDSRIGMVIVDGATYGWGVIVVLVEGTI
jgi:hypothetical protein